MGVPDANANAPALSGYEILSPLGRGAMGVVYLGRRPALDRLVAIKQLSGEWLGEVERLARFRREAETLAALNHPAIVAVYDLVVGHHDLCLVMEYVDGPSLRELIDSGDLEPAESLAVIGDVASALSHAAARGVVHRDVKPENVLITKSGQAKLADFGLVRLAEASGALTALGQVLGTPAYMSPEQCAGNEADSRSDVYSLAVMAYELLVRRLPYINAPGDMVATMQAHMHGSVPRPTSLKPGFPVAVERALLAGLARSPNRRCASAADFWHGLESGADRAWQGWPERSRLAAQAAQLSSKRAAAKAQSAKPETVETGPHSTLPGAASPSLANVGTLLYGAQSATAPPDQPAPGPTSTAAATLLHGGEPSAPPAVARQATSGQGAETLLYGPSRQPIVTSDATADMADRAERSASLSSAPTRPAVSVASPIARAGAAGVRLPATATRRRRRLLPIAAVVLPAAIALVVIALLLTRGSPAQTTPLSVSRIDVTVQPPVGICPAATYLFTATLHTNGSAGNVVYQWTEPDGSVSSPTTASVSGGGTSISATLRFSFNGSAPATGFATLRLLQPSPMSSSPAAVEYRCP